MAKLELPVRLFIESFMKRAFPERDFSRGSGINDLVIKAFSVLMQPFRHEIDVVKVNQSLSNYLYMRPADLDALAANWGKFRQTGARVEGSVRLYFNEAADYNLSFLEFTDDAGSTYTLASPVVIRSSDLLANRRPDSSFYYDVLVRSNGIGDRYVVPAGAIRTVKGGPTALFACENVADFQVTSPNESNYDVVNSMYRNIGLRNLVSRASIRAPLLDEFSNIVDMFITGSDHAKMYRDLVTVNIDGSDVELHLGGTVDVWCNTNALSQRQVTISYLPSSGKIRVVSADQAASGELAYAFSRGLLSPEGMFISPDDADVDLDESFSVEFDIDGIPVTAIVTASDESRRWPLALTDITGGSDLIPLPCRGQSQGVRSQYLVDPLGPNLGRTPAAVGDIISTSTHGRRRITAMSGRVMETSPVEDVYDAFNADSAVDAGDRAVPVASIVPANNRVNDRVRINEGAAAGLYNVLFSDSGMLYLGKPVAAGMVQQVTTLPNTHQQMILHGEQTAPDTAIITGAAVFEVIVNVTVTEIYFSVSLSAVESGDIITIAGVDPLVDGTYTIESVNTSGPNHFVTVQTVLIDVASPTLGTADIVHPAEFAPATLPPNVDTTYWVYTGPGAGHDQTPAYWRRILAITRDVNEIVLETDGAPVTVESCLVIGGLSGPLTVGDQLIMERDLSSVYPSVSVLDETQNPTLYFSSLPAELVAGTTTLSSVGIGEQAMPGDLVNFIGLTGVSEEDLVKTGGDGTKITAFIATVVSPDQVTLAAPFTFSVPVNTPFSVTKNRTAALASTTISAVNALTKTVQFSAFQRGIGDGVGMALALTTELLSLTIDAIDAAVGTPQSRVHFSSAIGLSNMRVSDLLVIDDSSPYDGTYRVISIDTDDVSVVIEKEFPAPFAGPGTLAATASRNHINPIVASTAGLVRLLKFDPPQKVFVIEMESDLYAAASSDDIGRTVEQTVGNTIYRGTIVSYDNATNTWEIAPNVLTTDLFTDTVTNFGSIGGFKASVPLGSETRIEFTAGVDLAAFTQGDKMVITGGTAIDGTYFLSSVRPDAVNPYVIVGGNLTPVAGPGPHGACTLSRPYFIRVLGSNAKGYPTSGGIDTNTGAGYDRGYVAPTLPADLGKVVRQGAYTGLLDDVDTTPGVYLWKVKPISDADLFDRTDVTTYVENSPSSPQPTDAQGSLLEPASLPTVDLSSVTFILANDPSYMTIGDQPSILPRFSRDGALIDGTKLRMQTSVFGAVTATDKVVLMAGDNSGSYGVAELGTDHVILDAEPAAELIRIANAPGPRRLPIPSGGLNLSSGFPIVDPGSDLGVWGGAGRILRIEGGGRVYNVPIGSNPTDDSVVPAYPIAVTLLPTTRWTYEVVEGFHTDFWVCGDTDLQGWRVYHPPAELGNTLLSRDTGAVSGGTSFRDTNADFRATIGSCDFASGDILLYIDSGSEANVEPITVTGLLSATQLSVAPHSFTSTESNIQYRIVYRPRVTSKEGWYRGVITAADTIKLQVDPGTELDRYNAICQAVVLVEPAPFGAEQPTWHMPRLTGTYDPATRELTVEVAAGTATSDMADGWTDGAGFNAAYLSALVRVHVRVVDRNVLTSADGSVLNTYNYYANREFFILPVARIQAVELLDSETLAPIENLEYTLDVLDKGLRYSAVETNDISIPDPDALFQPIRITYIADASIASINTYLNDPDTRVLGQNVMAKRMETLTVNISMRVRSERTSSSIAVAIASYINSLRSSRTLTKTEIIKYLFDESLISYVELDTMTMGTIYLPCDGAPQTNNDVSEIFGSDVACYLAGQINVTKITTGA